MTKTEALKLLHDLARASIRTYEVSNGLSKGNVEKAVANENRCARKILTWLPLKEEITDQEILDNL